MISRYGVALRRSQLTGLGRGAVVELPAASSKLSGIIRLKITRMAGDALSVAKAP